MIFAFSNRYGNIRTRSSAHASWFSLTEENRLKDWLKTTMLFSRYCSFERGVVCLSTFRSSRIALFHSWEFCALSHSSGTSKVSGRASYSICSCTDWNSACSWLMRLGYAKSSLYRLFVM